MNRYRNFLKAFWSAAGLLALFLLSGCAHQYPTLPGGPQKITSSPEYRIGPGDTLNIFVWRNPDLSTTIPVRPDGRITVPLVNDMMAAGKTPTQLGHDLQKALSKYVKHPFVTVMVTGFVGPYSQQIRVVGQATKPQSLPYRDHMTLLDVMIAVGGLTQYAAGNDALIVRKVHGKREEFRVRLTDLLNGDMSANVDMLPGDTLIIPEAWF